MNNNTSSRTRSTKSTRANAAAHWLRARYLARGAFGPFPADCAPRDVMLPVLVCTILDIPISMHTCSCIVHIINHL